MTHFLDPETSSGGRSLDLSYENLNVLNCLMVRKTKAKRLKLKANGKLNSVQVCASVVKKLTRKIVKQVQ